MRFRKLPVEIEAVKVMDLIFWTRSGAFGNVPDWADPIIIPDGADHVEISTLEGTMRGEYQDWIIRGVKGELYPCKPDIFAATYERVDDPNVSVTP